MLAIPAYDWRVHTCLLHAAVSTTMVLAAHNILLDIRTRNGDCHVDDAQNALIAEFLESDATDLVIMGSDQGWRAYDFLKLCQYDRDIVGVGVRKKHDAESYTVLLSAPEIWADRDGLVEVDTVGTGYLRLRRRVLETLAAKAETYRDPYSGRFVPFLVNRQIIDGERWSGDNMLCRLARAHGFKVYVDPELYTEHVGTKRWEGTLGDYWRRHQAQHEVAEAAAAIKARDEAEA